MGQVIARLARERGIEVAGMVGPGDASTIEEMGKVDAVVDFSYPGNLQMVLDAGNKGAKLIIGTTGYSEEQVEAIRQASEKTAVVFTGNFSTGITVLKRVVKECAQVLSDFDIEIVEKHHRMKEDAPSGTAKMLLEAVDPDGQHPVVHGRNGRPGARGHEIGMHALRGGTAAGEHSVYFLGDKEQIEIKHTAEDREIFARGALRALCFAENAQPGLYNMEDVLFGGIK